MCMENQIKMTLPSHSWCENILLMRAAVSYDDKESCVAENKDKTISAINQWYDGIAAESKSKWDDSGKHTWRGAMLQ